jgi:hypothetical protein
LVTPGELLAFAAAGAFVIGAIALARRTRRRWVPAAVGLTLAAIVTVGWVVPLTVGPTLECVDLDPTICESTLRSTQEGGPGLLPGTGLEQFFPVTRIRVEYVDDEMCGHQTRSIERMWIFTDTASCF